MAVQEERKYAIEAAIVRGMKMNRTMKMTELVHHVVRQLDYLFKAEPKCDRTEPTRQHLLVFTRCDHLCCRRYIRKRIADLIDRDFIQRDDDNPSLLHYIA